MKTFTNIDLVGDPDAARFIKVEVVCVRFAEHGATIESREGPNRYAKGDALITGSNGDQWSVTRDRFDARYEPVPPVVRGEAGRYQSAPVPVWAKQIAEDFSIARVAGGDLLRGMAGDWLMQYSPGDHGIVEQAKFGRVYRLFVHASVGVRSGRSTQFDESGAAEKG